MTYTKDYYEILGLSKSATEEEIKKAYRGLAVKFHPDKNPDNKSAEESFKEISEAYTILSNEHTRTQYDILAYSSIGNNEDNDWPDASQSIIVRAKDLKVKIKLNLKELYTGVKKQIKIHKNVSCRNCKSTGKIKTEICKTCNGEGVVLGEETLTINIPAGISDGMRLNMSGEGNAAPYGGINGNLLVFIEEVEHPFLKREGNNLIYSLNISFPESAIGATVEIPTIDSKIKIKLAAGTQSGKIVRIKEKGLTDIISHAKGDLLIHINVYTPIKLTIYERNLLDKLNKHQNFIPPKQEL